MNISVGLIVHQCNIDSIFASRCFTTQKLPVPFDFNVTIWYPFSDGNITRFSFDDLDFLSKILFTIKQDEDWYSTLGGHVNPLTIGSAATTE